MTNKCSRKWIFFILHKIIICMFRCALLSKLINLNFYVTINFDTLIILLTEQDTIYLLLQVIATLVILPL